MWRSAACAALLAFAGGRLGAQQSDTLPRTAQDSLVLRARRLGDNGSAADARKLLDSVLKIAAPESNSYADALYWRAALAPLAVDAERDYRRLLVESPLSARAEDAMLQLAQLEQARGDRKSATDHLQRFMLSYPNNPARPRVVVSLVRLLFEQGQTAKGCDALRLARETVAVDNLEQRNQLEFYGPRCVAFDAEPVTSADSLQAQKDSAAPPPPAAAPKPATPKPAAPKPATTNTAAPTAASFYSVQVAAYESEAPAVSMVRMLKSRGLDARVDGKTRPYRVRVGRYATRATAVQALADLKAQGIGGFVALVKSER